MAFRKFPRDPRRHGRRGRRTPVPAAPRGDVPREEMARLCSIYACDRATGSPTIDLPRPDSPECGALFLATWAAFRYVTTQLGILSMAALGKPRRSADALEAFVHGREIPAYLRWAETEAMIRAEEDWRARPRQAYRATEWTTSTSRGERDGRPVLPRTRGQPYPVRDREVDRD